MKLMCHRESLLSAFQTAAVVVPTRSPKPILQNVKLVSSEEKSLLLATDLEIGVRCQVPNVKVEKPGEAILPTGRITSILRELTDEEISLQSEANASILKGQSSQFTLPAEDPEQFPEIPDFEGEKKYHIVPAALLRSMIRRTVFATDIENTRYALGGVLVELGPQQITMVGTDGRRLAVMEGPAQSHGGHKTDENPHVVPTKAMNLIERTLHDDNTEVTVGLRANEVLVRTERAVIYSRLVEGRFPRYQDVIPKQSKLKAEFLADPLLRAVRQAAIVTSEESRGVEFRFRPGELTLSAQAAEVGQSEVQMPLSYDGAELAITFDPRYVIEFLRVLDPETPLTLGLNDPESAAVWQTADGYHYVIMPLSRER